MNPFPCRTLVLASLLALAFTDAALARGAAKRSPRPVRPLASAPRSLDTATPRNVGLVTTSSGTLVKTGAGTLQLSAGSFSGSNTVGGSLVIGGTLAGSGAVGNTNAGSLSLRVNTPDYSVPVGLATSPVSGVGLTVSNSVVRGDANGASLPDIVIPTPAPVETPGSNSPFKLVTIPDPFNSGVMVTILHNTTYFRDLAMIGGSFQGLGGTVTQSGEGTVALLPNGGVNAVPEPGSILLLGGGVLLIAARRLRPQARG